MARTNRILIIVTNADEYEKVGFRTGLWLGELTHFYDVAEEAGYQMDIASPSGGKIPLDPESLIISEVSHTVGMGGSVSQRYENRAYMNLLQNTPKVSESNVAAYDAIYMTGGHGVMFDFPKSAALAKLTVKFYESNKIIAAVCHGPAGLLEVKLGNGDSLINGKAITGFSWREEELAKRDHAVPFNLEAELQKRGAKYSKALLPFGSHVVEDGLLITGQNPLSAHDVGKAVVKKLQEAP
ncbi:type 1 glutamine amidotransferase domain-containing protein [Nitrosomonas sp. Nm166]|uniref:type 1 glutamine amidotransferase domain-containing protein n=1 Tax=Nitrosomonas sp. Nm166 TaxID=1881054 RepID=UPI0008F1AE2A|nr:type 1 glutamine amidotransferase domain-containing protein [Nitrosomonas sp. Nm166]SFE22674.1 Putative intracellular protease/amidase [Nitrosomonas sp. Nm166]